VKSVAAFVFELPPPTWLLVRQIVLSAYQGNYRVTRFLWQY